MSHGMKTMTSVNADHAIAVLRRDWAETLRAIIIEKTITAWKMRTGTDQPIVARTAGRSAALTIQLR